MYEFQVVDDHGTTWPNLYGVFRRVFPIVVGKVTHGGQPQGVTYYGEHFTVERVDADD